MKPLMGTALVSILLFAAENFSYYLSPRNETLERDGGAQLVFLISILLSFCAAAAYLACYPFYRSFYRSRGRVHSVIYSLCFFTFLYAVTHTAIIKPIIHWLLDLLIPQISGNDTLNIVITFAFATLSAAAVFFLLFYGADWLWKRLGPLDLLQKSKGNATHSL